MSRALLAIQLIDNVIRMAQRAPEVVAGLQAMRDDFQRIEDEGRDVTDAEWQQILEDGTEHAQAILSAHGGLDSA